MKTLCECIKKRRADRKKVPCGRSGRRCRVIGGIAEKVYVLCSAHRKREAKNYSIAVLPAENKEDSWLS
jgi:hypothetical protein